MRKLRCDIKGTHFLTVPRNIVKLLGWKKGDKFDFLMAPTSQGGNVVYLKKISFDIVSNLEEDETDNNE